MENSLEKGRLKCYSSSRKPSGTTSLFWTFSNYIVESAGGHGEKNPES